MGLSAEDLLKLYRNLVVARKVDEAAIANSANCNPSVHAGIGQEAVGTGACTFLRPDDLICQTHRGFAHVVAKGLSLEDLFCECFNRANSPTKGHGGTWHQAKPSIGSYGLSGTIGGVFNLAAGLGIACQHKGKGQVVVAFFGDGQSNRGTLHEAMNLSAVWKLPVVFVCENNGYAAGQSIKGAINVQDIASFAGSYGIPGVVADGNDVVAVHDAVAVAVDRARQGQGPSLVECKTYRITAHYVGAPDYRSAEEREAWKMRDPVVLFREKLLAQGILTPELVNRIEKESQDAVDAAVKFAEESPLPDPADYDKELYAE